MPQRVIPPYASVHIPAEVFKNQERELTEMAAKSEAEFRVSLDDACRAGQWLLQKGFPEQQLCSRASYADRVVMSQPAPDLIGRRYPQQIRDWAVAGARRAL